ncbi:MAG: hypothetical protein QHH75_01255 [Bacillota bacterium]|nr:hypothetical protein [Bacillota bacterium]
MAYQLSFWEVIKAFFVPVDPVFYLFLAILLAGVGIPVGSLLYALRKGVPFRKLLLMPVTVMVVLAVIPVMSLLYTGSGWRLENGKLQMKATPGALESVELKKARVTLVESTGPWQATLRTNGIGLSGFSAGRFKFKNGKEALYFRYVESPHKVVLESDGRYYVLSYPGVEELYWELIARGARPAEL